VLINSKPSAYQKEIFKNGKKQKQRKQRKQMRLKNQPMRLASSGRGLEHGKMEMTSDMNSSR
jgi:hypothetical protein